MQVAQYVRFCTGSFLWFDRIVYSIWINGRVYGGYSLYLFVFYSGDGGNH